MYQRHWLKCFSLARVFSSSRSLTSGQIIGQWGIFVGLFFQCPALATRVNCHVWLQLNLSLKLPDLCVKYHWSGWALQIRDRMAVFTDSRISKPKEGLHSRGSNFFGPAMNLLRENWKDLIWLYVPARSSTLKKNTRCFWPHHTKSSPKHQICMKACFCLWIKKKKKSQAEQSWNFEVYQIWTYLLNKSKF